MVVQMYSASSVYSVPNKEFYRKKLKSIDFALIFSYTCNSGVIINNY